MQLGLNCDPLHWEDPVDLANRLADTNCSFIVFPWNGQHSHEYAAYGEALEGVGIEPVPVLAQESLQADDGDQQVQKALQRILSALPMARHLVLGNEQDADLLPIKSERSWVMKAADFMSLLSAGKQHCPATLTLITGGTVSGQPSWWDGITELHGALRHAHLYAQDPDSVRLVLQAHRHAGCPIRYCLEFGWPYPGDAQEAERANQLSQFLISLAEEGIEYAAPFRFSDRGDVVEQFGLADEDGNWRESLAAFHDAAVALR
jgi:hypothetical protein